MLECVATNMPVTNVGFLGGGCSESIRVRIKQRWKCRNFPNFQMKNDRRSCELRKEAWKIKKIQDFNGAWTHDLAIPVRCASNWAMKPLTLGAGPNSVENLACVAWRFWLGALSNKGERGQRNREEIGAGATNSKRPIMTVLKYSDSRTSAFC